MLVFLEGLTRATDDDDNDDDVADGFFDAGFETELAGRSTGSRDSSSK